MRKLYLITISAIFLINIGISKGELTLYLMVDAEKFYLTGSDAGTAVISGFGNKVIWGTNSTTGITTLGFSALDIASASPIQFDSVLNEIGGENSSSNVFFKLNFTNPGTTTITAGNTPTPQSYSSLPTDIKNNLKSKIGSSLSLVTGTGFSSLRIVPELSTYSIFASLGTFALCIGRRKRYVLNV